MSDEIPGRQGEVRGFAISNARRTVEVETEPRVVGGRYVLGEWGVRLGKRMYPDYARPHPTRWDGEHGGTYLSADDAEAIGRHLLDVAAWARAQNCFTSDEVKERRSAA